KDGTIKIHYTCSNHILDIYNKIEIENNKVKEKLVANISINYKGRIFFCVDYRLIFYLLL
ncbi:MAG: hypothetical protein ACXWFZ_13005, partial [Nitrososphaeraceae archaeon]